MNDLIRRPGEKLSCKQGARTGILLVDGGGVSGESSITQMFSVTRCDVIRGMECLPALGACVTTHGWKVQSAACGITCFCTCMRVSAHFGLKPLYSPIFISNFQ